HPRQRLPLSSPALPPASLPPPSFCSACVKETLDARRTARGVGSGRGAAPGLEDALAHRLDQLAWPGPDLQVGHFDHDEPGRLELGDATTIGELVDERAVVALALDLDDQRQGGVAKVHPTRPSVATRVDLSPEVE